jgi:aspartate/methionine/tyrosine aminotransferase
MFLLQFALDANTLIQSPSWVSYINQSVVLDAPATPVPTTFENKWKFVPESFKGKINDDDNQLVIINYPGNPTGQNYTDDELKALSEVLDRDNTLIMSDEIYAELAYENASR